MAFGWVVPCASWQASTILLLLLWHALWQLWYERCFMDVFHPFDSRCDVSFRLMVCSGHHVSLRLLSLHVCNECPSLPKKKKKRAPLGPSPYSFSPSMLMASEGGKSGRHYLQLCKLGHGMLLLFKRHIMPAKQKQQSFFFFFGLQGRCASSDGKAPTETPN